jgi:hypothetical protein
MEDIRLPRHVIDRLEHRWASRLQQAARDCSIDRGRPMLARQVHIDGSRAKPVVKRSEQQLG